MNFTMTALDLHFLVIEMQDLLNAKFEKIYQPGEKEFLFVLHIPNKGRRILRVHLPGVMFLSDFKGDVPEQPSQFCMFLRKYLSNCRIRAIEQMGFERIIRLSLETKDSKYNMYIEMFSAGNIILCDEHDIVRSALLTKRWKDRTIRGNIEYTFPKRENNLLTLTLGDLKKILGKTDKESIVKFCALELGLGGRYSEELCARAEIDKNKKTLTEDETKRLFEQISRLRDSKVSASISEGIVLPVEMKTIPPGEKMESYSSALDKALTEKVIKEHEIAADSAYDKEKKRIDKVIAEQEETMVALKKSIKENQEKGELIFTKYSEISEILATIRLAREKYSWKEIKEKLKNHKIIKRINEKDKTVIIEV